MARVGVVGSSPAPTARSCRSGARWAATSRSSCGGRRPSGSSGSASSARGPAPTRRRRAKPARRRCALLAEGGVAALWEQMEPKLTAEPDRRPRADPRRGARRERREGDPRPRGLDRAPPGDRRARARRRRRGGRARFRPPSPRRWPRRCRTPGSCSCPARATCRRSSVRTSSPAELLAFLEEIAVTGDELAALLADDAVNLVDVRTPTEYDGHGRPPCDPVQGHIPGAVNIELEELLHADRRKELRRAPRGARRSTADEADRRLLPLRLALRASRRRRSTRPASRP